MDHIYLDYIQFLWAHTTISPCTYMLYKIGSSRLLIRSFLAKYGIIKINPFDVQFVIGKLCLEQCQVIQYGIKKQEPRKNTKSIIAGFFFPDFGYIDNDCEFRVADLLMVEIDLETKRFVRARMDEDELTAQQVLILLSFNTITAQHVKLHAYANWGVNTHKALKEENRFLYRNSIVTVMYNHFGYSSFSSYIDWFSTQGILSKDWNGGGAESMLSLINHGLKQNVSHHSNIYELIPYSRFVRFIVKVRKIFFQEFKKHKESFPGVDAESMFIGTILHSLDHTLFEWNLKDPLWLCVDDSKFGKMAEMARLVRVGFVEDLPCVPFHKLFKGSGEPFYEAVYKRAAKIDKELADKMDTCIIK